MKLFNSSWVRILAVAAAFTLSTSLVGAEGRSGEEVYNTACVACHATGLLDAPKPNDRAAWEPRLTQGMDTLMKHTIEGFNGTMPQRGTCFACSDEELQAAVEYMIEDL